MPQYAIEFDLSLMDLWTLLFRKKACPQCGMNLARHSVKDSTGPKWQWQTRESSINGWYGDRTKVRLTYLCEHCHLRFSLSQLRLGLPGETTTTPVEPRAQGPGAQ